MIVALSEIKKLVFISLLSLAVYGLASQIVEWTSVKCPWDTKKTKFAILLVITIISAVILFGHFKTNHHAKTQRRIKKDALYKKIGLNV